MSVLRGSLSAFFVVAFSLVSGPFQNASAQAISGPALLQTNRVADQVESNVRVQVAGHIPSWATTATDVGAVAGDAPQLLTFDVARSPEVQTAFEQLLTDQQNPASPRYHQWLTPQQIGEQYGPTQHDLDAFTTWLTGQGFIVSNVTPSRVFVQATAPASVVNSALQVSLHNFALGAGKLQAPLTEPAFPAALAPMVKFVSGLATVQKQTFSTVMPLQPLSAIGARASADATSTAHPDYVHPDYTLSGGAHYLAPADFNLIYDVTPTLTSGITGSGYRVAIIGGSRLLASDLTSWESLSALNTYQPNYIIPAGLTDPGITSDGNQGEGTLDFERVYGTAPGVQVDQVISKNWLSSDTDTLQLYAINTLNDPVLTMSYGSCESGFSAYAQHENALFSQAIAQGISVFASSGDSGVAGCESQGVAPPVTQSASIEVPCDSVYLTCVGGTQFSDTTSPATYWSTTNGVGKLSALSYIPEGAWNEPTYTTTAGTTAYEIAASTGGPSVAIAKPIWQTGSGVPADSVRDVPDVAFSSSSHNAYFSCLAYAGADCTTYLTGFGGTSAAAPSMAGLAALIDQKLGKRQGLLNPALYRTAASTPAAFHDATPATSGVASCTTAIPSTCNNSNAAPNSLTGGIAGYPLLVGYDFPTGLGSLDFGAFLTAISLPVPTITLTASPNAITISQSVVFTAKLTGTSGVPTGTIQFNAIATAFGSPSNALGAPVTLNNGSASSSAFNFAPATTYSVTATYSGDANYSPGTSAVYSLVVTNPNAIPSSATLTVTPAPATTLQSTTLSATIKGAGATPTGTVTFFDSGTQKTLPVGLNSSGVGTLAIGTLGASTHVFTCIYSGDSVYAQASCAAVSDVVSAVPSTTVETLSSSTISASGSTLLSYVVSSTAGGTPTGTITAFAQQLTPTSAAAASLGSVPVTSGYASGTLSGVSPGTYNVYGVYSGDTAYNPSTSNTLFLTVTGFAMTSTPASLSVSAGATSGNSVAVTYTSIGGFAGTITESCALASAAAAVPIAPSCSVSARTIPLTGATATSTVTVNTSSANAIGGGLQTVGSLRTGAIGGVSFAGLLLFLFPARRRLRNWRAMSALVLFTIALFSAAGCGSGGGVATGTTKGVYTLTITASGSGQTSTTTTAVTIN